MLHSRLDSGLHRASRITFGEQDTTLQNWVVRALTVAARKAGMRGLAYSQDAG
jgi:hypothetical protein